MMLFRMPTLISFRFFLPVLMLAAALWPAAGARAAGPLPDVQVASRGYHIVINLPQTRLFLYRDGALEKSYPIAVGKVLTQTPAGEYAVTGIHRDPTWHVPKSIQEEMRRKGKPVQTEVPPGPDNPLGKVFIRFGEPRLALGIHGTNAPSSVPGFRSHGCVRLTNDNALELAGKVGRTVPVSVINQSVMLNADTDRRLWLTAFRDHYRQAPMTPDEVLAAARRWAGPQGGQVNAKLVREVLSVRHGQPVCITCNDLPEVMKADLAPVRWLSGT